MSSPLSNPYIRALAGGLGSALAVAGPLVDDGIRLGFEGDTTRSGAAR